MSRPAEVLVPAPRDSGIVRVMTVFDDLAAEQDRLDAILSGLSDGQWAAPSLAVVRTYAA